MTEEIKSEEEEAETQWYLLPTTETRLLPKNKLREDEFSENFDEVLVRDRDNENEIYHHDEGFDEVDVMNMSTPKDLDLFDDTAHKILQILKNRDGLTTLEIARYFKHNHIKVIRRRLKLLEYLSFIKGELEPNKTSKGNNSVNKRFYLIPTCEISQVCRLKRSICENCKVPTV